MIIKREMASRLLDMSKQFPVVAIMGPRQSGKTTLSKTTFSSYAYVTLEDIDTRLRAIEDPRKFFASYAQASGLIIDEIQEAPQLLSYMQGIVDQEYKPGFFIITGSQNFLMHEKITQTLAGRIAILTLLPLTVSELANADLLPKDLESLMFKGFYPRLYSQPIEIEIWFSTYITTYLERDVRQIINIGNVVSFQKFLKLCAARIGNIINYAELARDCDISPNTAKAWLSLLENSYVIKLLQPYYKNFNKRVIKSPKLYFCDVGLACHLLSIRGAQDLFIHPLRGALFESFVVSELYKYYYNQIKTPHIYFWRDVAGHEIDCVLETAYNKVIPIEIKSGMTINSDFFKNLISWKEITDQKDIPSFLVYAGDENQERSIATVISWSNVKSIIESINK